MTSSLYHGARRAVLALFFVHGFVYASWVSRIPAVQGALHLTAAELGLALLGFAAGSIPAMVLCGALIGRYGSRPLSIATTLAFCLALPAMALAPAGPWLFFALCLFGLGGGSMDVASNAHGAEVERLAGRSVMSSFHAFFSLGAMAGAGLGGLAAGYGLSPLPHFVLAAVVSAAATAAWSRRLLPAAVDAAPHGPMLAWPSRALLGLSALAYCMVLSEGAMADWTALYLGRVLSAHAGVAALGYACFSGAMMVGRALGDRLADRLGRVNLVRCGTLLGAAGLAAALLAPSAPLALAGFTVAGAGFSVVVPMVFAAAARRGRTPGLGMATVMTAGYAGLLTGPPAIGTLAAAFSLRAALLLPVALVLGAFALAGRTAPPAPTAAPDPCLNNNS